VFDLAFPLATPNAFPDHGTPVTFTDLPDNAEEKKYANNSI
jgi:hypothetical protein